MLGQHSTIRINKIAVKSGMMKFENRLIVPGSLLVEGVSSSDYVYDAGNATLRWINIPAADSVTLRYRIFNITNTVKGGHLFYDSILKKDFISPLVNSQKNLNTTQGWFSNSSVQTTGSIGKQLGFGNAQDAVVHSNLNLQLSGYLADSIEVSASISDNNLPIQPDGSTRRLSELNQVYLQFRKKPWTLSVGDIDLESKQSDFFHFYKRVQGASFQTKFTNGDKNSSSSLVSAGVAKGKFTKQVLSVSEGNQGPYRLSSPTGELYFVLLANTERVYLNGQLLERGEDGDYVINYNTAELTFTAKQMITKDSRVQVEFQYVERNYLNSDLVISQEFNFNKKWAVRIGAFQHADSKNATIDQSLSASQKQYLSNIGDSLQNAFYSAVSIDTSAAVGIRYEKLYNGTDSFYRYSNDRLTAKYVMSFMDLGEGNGNYIPDFVGANGKVYKYVAPIAGVKQGRFEPVQLLVTPKKQQLISVGVDYKKSGNSFIKTDLAISNNDWNRFSRVNKKDDKGIASKIEAAHLITLNANKKIAISGNVAFEYVNEKFTPIERLRDVEFLRSWGLPFLMENRTEKLVHSGIQFDLGLPLKLGYNYSNYIRDGEYSGIKHYFYEKFKKKNLQIDAGLTKTKFDFHNTSGGYFKPYAEIGYKFLKLNQWKIGLRFETEKNEIREKLNNKLQPGAYSFDNWTLYFRSNELLKNSHQLSFYTRTEKYASNTLWIKGDRSYNFNWQTQLLSNERRQLYFNATYRQLQLLNSVSAKQATNTFLGRAEYLMNEWKGALKGNVNYEVGSGQEQKKDIAFVEVPAGQGQYTWFDYNSDGIQQLNEFELAIFQDQAKFVKLYTPTNQYIGTRYLNANYRLTLDPRWFFSANKKSALSTFLSRMVFISVYQLTQKSLSTISFSGVPFGLNLADTGLIHLSGSMQNTLSYNRFNPKWGIDISNLKLMGKQLMSYGPEYRNSNDWTFKQRISLHRFLTFFNELKLSEFSLITEGFSNKNYRIKAWKFTPSFQWVYKTSFTFNFGIRIEQKDNSLIYGAETEKSSSLNFEGKYVLPKQASIAGKFSLQHIQFDFPTANTIGYVMLEGLMPGQNAVWAFDFNKRIMNNLQLNIQYDGRKAGTVKVIHTGRVGVTALF